MVTDGAKVEQLCGMLRECGGGVEVSVVKDETMRTNKGGAGSEGSDRSKNAIVVGIRPRTQSVQRGGVKRGREPPE